MNASTPERLALKLRASLNMIGDGDWTPQDMAASRLCDAVLGLRVEEPAGEPDATTNPPSVLGRDAQAATSVGVARSANADVPFPPNEIIRHLADATDHLLRHHNCDTLGYETWQAALDAARALPGALPVPVRDGEALLRSALDRIAEAERIDKANGFVLPGDCALYVTLWAIESELEYRGNPDNARSICHTDARKGLS